MKKTNLTKKVWKKPSVKELRFKDTFGGKSLATYEAGDDYRSS